VEPHIPFAFELGGTVLVVLYAALVIISLVSLSKAPQMSGGQRTVWVIAILFLPLVGAAMWLAISSVERRTRERLARLDPLDRP
jgi:hypothetical protein